MIASIVFRNFKALRAARLELAPFNLVIGPNGSGKTSLIQALLQLRSLARLPLAAPEPTHAEWPEIVFRFSPPYETLSARVACVSDVVCDLLEVTPANAPGWPALREEIGRIRAYALDHEAMAKPARLSDGIELTANGSNLAAVLVAWRQREPRAFAAFVTEMLRLMPEFTRFDFIEHSDQSVELGLMLGEGERVAADDLSQGTLYLIAILTLAFNPAGASLVCLEEADRGIHPRMLREVRDMLYRLSYPASLGLSRTSVQVIATTHSPYLVDLLREHPEEIVISSKRGREACFSRLSDRADLQELLQEGSLGDMWFSGILGGIPDRE